MALPAESSDYNIKNEFSLAVCVEEGGNKIFQTFFMHILVVLSEKISKYQAQKCWKNLLKTLIAAYDKNIQKNIPEIEEFIKNFVLLDINNHNIFQRRRAIFEITDNEIHLEREKFGEG